MHVYLKSPTYLVCGVLFTDFYGENGPMSQSWNLTHSPIFTHEYMFSCFEPSLFIFLFSAIMGCCSLSQTNSIMIMQDKREVKREIKRRFTYLLWKSSVSVKQRINNWSIDLHWSLFFVFCVFISLLDNLVCGSGHSICLHV